MKTVQKPPVNWALNRFSYRSQPQLAAVLFPFELNKKFLNLKKLLDLSRNRASIYL